MIDQIGEAFADLIAGSEGGLGESFKFGFDASDYDGHSLVQWIKFAKGVLEKKGFRIKAARAGEFTFSKFVRLGLAIQGNYVVVEDVTIISSNEIGFDNFEIVIVRASGH